MINITEEKLAGGVIDAIVRNGYKLERHNNAWITCSTAEVQTFIDNYDALATLKSEARQRIISQVEKEAEARETLYPEIEKRTFAKQEAEAIAFMAEPTSPVPMLSVIAKARGVSIVVLAAKVIKNSQSDAARIGALSGARQKANDLIGAEKDYRIVQQINLVI